MNILNKLLIPYSNISELRNRQYSASSLLSVFLIGLFLLMNGTAHIYGQTQTFTSTAPGQTFTVPAGVTSINVKAWGAGGGSGGTLLPNSSQNGGGGGAYAESYITVVPGNTYSVTVGAGGTGSTVAGGQGVTGGSTVFGPALVSALGGTGGGTGSTTVGQGGSASASVGTVKFSGGNGGVRTTPLLTGSGGGGGGSAGSGGNGGNGGNAVGATGGTAGAAGIGTSPGATGGAGGSTGAIGNNGTAPGGGGGGQGNRGFFASGTGNGGNGKLILTWGPSTINITGTTNPVSCTGVGTPFVYTINNTSPFPANNITVTSNDPQFVVTGAPTTIPASSSANFTVTFTPASAGTQNAILTVTGTSGLVNTLTYSLSGTGSTLPSAPIVGAITQPACGAPTGSVALSGLPTTPWTVTASPGGATLTGSTATATFTGLSGSTSYTFTVTSGCTSLPSTAADIDANPTNTITLTSAALTDQQSVCLLGTITPITYATTGATNTTVVGLPPDLIGAWSGGVLTITGLVTNANVPATYTYTVTTVAAVTGCETSTTGTVKVNANNNTINLTSASGTDAQNTCYNTLITPITYATTGASGATFSGLPMGVTGTWAADVVTISGTPDVSVSGNFTYTITLTGGCGNVSTTGTINVGTETKISYAGTPFCATGTASVNQIGAAGASLTPYSSTPGLVINGSTGAIDLALSTPGTYVVTYTYGGSCASTATATVVINPLPKTSLSPLSPTACVGSPITIYSLINPATTGNYNHVWTVSGSVSGVSTGVTSPLTTSEASFTGTAGGSVVVTYNVTDGNGCAAAQASVTVNIQAPPVATSAGLPQSKCGITDFTLAAQDLSAQPSGSTGLWTIVSGSGVLSNPSSPTSDITGVPGGTTTTLKWTVTNGPCTATTEATTTVTNVSPSLSSTLTPAATCGAPFTYAATSGTIGASYTWTRAAVSGISQVAGSGTGDVNETLTNTTSLPIPVTYVYITSESGCFGAPQDVIVTVNPKATIHPMTADACSGNAILAISPVDGVDGVVPSGTTYSLSAPVLSTLGGITGSLTGGLTITGTLTNTTGTLQTATYTVTPTSGSCVGATFTLVVSVYPKPVITPTTMTLSTCSGVLFTSITPVNGTNGVVPVGTTYTWAVPSVSGLPGDLTGGAAGSNETSFNSGLIADVLVNHTNTDQTATYLVTPSVNGCSGNAFTVVVTVKPTPSMSSASTMTPICNGGTASYSPAASAFSGATFTWSRAAITGITEPATTGSGSSIEVLHNTTVNPITVTYVYVTTANGCSNAGENVTVVVYPKPVLSSSLTAAVCSPAAPFTYTATSLTAGTTASWSRAAGGVTEGPTSAPSAALPITISEPLTNAGTAPVTVTYIFTMTANGCTNTQDVVVTVNPLPKLSNSSLVIPAICSGGTVSFIAASATAGATFSWTRPVVPGIPELPITIPVLNGSISETLTNTTTAPIVVTYIVTIKADGCTNTENVTVTVNPTPKLSNSPLVIPAICSGTAASFIPASATSGATYAWSRVAVGGIGEGTNSGTGNISEILTNITNTIPITATYNIVTTANGCSNTGQNVTVVVNPKLTLSSSLTPPAICSGATFAYTATSPVSGATFAWSRAAITGITPATSSGTNNISEALTNTTSAPITVTYVYLLTANGCSDNVSVTVVVNPMPAVHSFVPTTCSGGTFAILPQNGTDGTVPAGITYSWSAPSVSGSPGDVTGGIGGGPSATIISGTLTNNTTIAQTAIYTVTPSANGCTGTSFTVTVTVNPKPKLSSLLSLPDQCSGAPLSYTPTSATTGTTFAWSRAAVTGISNPAASGTTNGITSINETLINTTISPITVTYVIISTANGCSNTENVTVVVKPTPHVNHNFNYEICSGFAITPPVAPVNITDGLIPSGTTYSWMGSASSAEPNFTTGVLNNLGTTQIIKTYSVTPALGTCSGSAFDVVVKVNPTPSISGVLNVCVGATTSLMGSTPPAASNAWVSASIDKATVSPSGVVTGVAAGTSVITYTDSKGCLITTTVTVNAKPKATIATATGADFISQNCTVALTATITGGQSPYSPNVWSSTSTLLQFSTSTGMSTNIAALTSPVVDPSAAATINFMTHDANVCDADASPLPLTVYPELKANITGASKVCISPSANATITLDPNITGGYAAGTSTAYPAGRKIEWSSSDETVATVSSAGVVTGVLAGSTTISVVVTDASGCSATSSFSVTVNAAPVSTPTISNVNCNGANDGIICLTTTGASPFSYTWNNPGAGTSNCNSGLAPATYSVTTKDNNGCTSALSGLTVTEPGAISATISGTTAVCQTGSDPSVTFTGAGGTAPYTFTYTYNNGSSTVTRTATTVSGNSIAVPHSISTSGTGTFTYTLVSVTSGVCTKSQTGTATITIGVPLVMPLDFAGPDQPAVGASTTLAGVLGTATSGLWSVVPANPSITFSNVTLGNSTVSNLPFGATKLGWTVSKDGCSAYDEVVLTRNSITLDIVAALEGPLDNVTGRMNANIRLLTSFPTDGLGNPGIVARSVTGLHAIVDWVTIELRTVGNVPASGNFVRQGLIRTDGHIVEATSTDVTTPLKFDVPDGNYFIVVNHRNHLGFRSNAQENLMAAASPITLNFAIGNVLPFGAGSLKFINGVYCAYAGDGSSDDDIDATDYNQWKPKRFVDGYEPADFNLDGTVDSRDYSIWTPNRFKTSQY